jgi:RimJ/RimL family protein N-acetyltransferase
MGRAVTTVAAQPELSDGVVRLRRFEVDDAPRVLPLEDDEMRYRFGFPSPSELRHLTAAIEAWHDAWADNRRIACFLVTLAADGTPVGMCDVKGKGGGLGQLSWCTYAPHRRRGHAARAVSLLCAFAFAELGMVRLEASIEADNIASRRVARQAGLRQAGRPKAGEVLADGRCPDVVLVARLSSDQPRRGDRL